jgi:metallo-beta-lactamase family protein
MKINLFGASGGEVTGSAYLVESGKSKVLIDCGLFQGVPDADQRNRIPERFTFRHLDAVLVTHAHLDHTGRLPILAQRKYAGWVYGTEATAELAGLILRDAAKIQDADLQRFNRRRQREGRPPLGPLYSAQDVESIVGRFRIVGYDKAVVVAPGIEARWTETGHLLGSASIQLRVEESGRVKTIVFSGDVGQSGIPLTRGAGVLDRADVVFLESTYGDRDHRSFRDSVAELAETVRTAVERNGKILVPTFAVGRAQLLVALLAWLFRKKEVKPFPVYLDSPMAIAASRIYLRHPELWHERLGEIVRQRPLREELQKSKSRLCVTAEESRALNGIRGTCMILAGAGMCNAGRILHHLRNNVWKPETSVVIVGYQATRTVGRALVDGAKEIRIFGEKIVVRGSVHTLGGFSAHAGQSDLVKWLAPMAHCQPRVFLTHGEDRSREALARCIEQHFRIKPELPGTHSVIEV